MLNYQKLKQKKFYVFGLGKSGILTAQFLKKIGAKVEVGDDQEHKLLYMKKQGFNIIDIKNQELKDDYTLILAPGIPTKYPQIHPVVKKAKQKNLTITGDIEIFITNLDKNYQGKIIAVTGTNGKSTTTALLNHCLKKKHKKSVMCGNIGIPIFDMQCINNTQPEFCIIEISSYQIELLIKAKFDAAILLNISHDHLDRHGNINNYKNVKAKLVKKHLKKNAPAIIGTDDQYSAQIYSEINKLKQNIITISDEKLPNNIDDILKNNPALKGAHNKQNIIAVSIICNYFNIKNIDEGIKTFVSLPHRMEIVAKKDGIIFINDSKATNAQATKGAIKSLKNIYWISGGIPKKQGIKSLLSHLDNIKKTYLIGQAAQKFAFDLKGKSETYIADKLEPALEKAYADAQQESKKINENINLLFSPACASFDQFDNFEKRGEAFRNWVNNKIKQNS